MNREQAADALGISLRTLDRRLAEGKIQGTKRGRNLEFTREGLGLPPEPTLTPTEPTPAEPTQPYDSTPADDDDDDWSLLPVLPQEPVEDARAHTPDSEPSIESLDSWTTAELQAALPEWRKCSDPLAPASNVPATHSSSMPSPENFARLVRANAILELRSFGVQPQPKAGKPGRAFSTGMLGPSRHPDSYRPKTGFGLTQQDLEAESLTLRLHPSFAKNRYAR